MTVAEEDEALTEALAGLRVTVALSIAKARGWRADRQSCDLLIKAVGLPEAVAVISRRQSLVPRLVDAISRVFR